MNLIHTYFRFGKIEDKVLAKQILEDISTNITSSLGVSTYGEKEFPENPEMSPEELKAARIANSKYKTPSGIVELADFRLYVSKARGRNQVTSEKFGKAPK